MITFSKIFFDFCLTIYLKKYFFASSFLFFSIKEITFRPFPKTRLAFFEIFTYSENSLGSSDALCLDPLDFYLM